MKQLSLIAFLCLACCTAMADFQLTDPAAGYEQKTLTIDAGETGDFAVEGAGIKTCGDYLADSKKQGAQHFIGMNNGLPCFFENFQMDIAVDVQA